MLIACIMEIEKKRIVGEARSTDVVRQGWPTLIDL